MGRVKSWFMSFDVVDTEQEYDQGEYVTVTPQDMLPVYPKHTVEIGEVVVSEEPTAEEWKEYVHYMQSNGL